MKQEIRGFLAYIGAERGLSVQTIRAYRHDLTKFAEFAGRELGKDFEVTDIDQYTIKGYMQFLANNGYKKINSAVSRGRKLATIKSFCKFLTAEGKIKINPAEQVKMPRTQRKEPSYLTEQEYKRLLRAVRNNATRYYKQRDMAIIMMFLGIGLRLNELVQLNIGDINFEDGTVKVTRKGNHERILPASDDVMISIKRYIRTKKTTSNKAPLFVSKRKQRISGGSVWHLVRKYLKQAQIEKDKLSPHTLRHTFATTLLKQGQNIVIIKELLSHRNLRTTEKYLHINGEDLKTAVDKIDLDIR
ncbi:site-specific tyrosine recombinase/integron integrase [Candidatus Omnitrophota bacterium]